jgi:hypothetical protein
MISETSEVNKDEAILEFDHNVIEHLGIRLYQTSPAASSLRSLQIAGTPTPRKFVLSRLNPVTPLKTVFYPLPTTALE